MKKIIYKYPIEQTTEFTITFPTDNFKILHIGETFPVIHYDEELKLFMWVEISLEENPSLDTSIEKTFTVMATGEPFDGTGLKYLKTLITHGGNFVWHIYENINEE